MIPTKHVCYPHTGLVGSAVSGAITGPGTGAAKGTYMFVEVRLCNKKVTALCMHAT